MVLLPGDGCLSQHAEQSFWSKSLFLHEHYCAYWWLHKTSAFFFLSAFNSCIFKATVSFFQDFIQQFLALVADFLFQLFTTWQSTWLDSNPGCKVNFIVNKSCPLIFILLFHLASSSLTQFWFPGRTWMETISLSHLLFLNSCVF